MLRNCSTKTNFTLLSSLEHQYLTCMNVHLITPILEWCFKVHILWILEVLLYLLCSMRMPPFLDRACHIIPYTVRFFVLYYINYAHFSNYITYTYFSYAVSLLNLHEDERMKPRNWIPMGWCMMKAGTSVRARDSIRHQPANFDYTISVGSNSLTSGRRGQRMLSCFLGRME